MSEASLLSYMVAAELQWGGRGGAVWPARAEQSGLQTSSEGSQAEQHLQNSLRRLCPSVSITARRLCSAFDSEEQSAAFIPLES